MSFYNLYQQGMARVAAATIPVVSADPSANAQAIIATARTAAEAGAAVTVFPELSVCGYALDDLVLQESLLDSVLVALIDITRASNELSTVLIVGAPLRIDGMVYNCAVAIARGRVLGVTPKVYLPNYREFYEKRYFASGSDLPRSAHIPDLPLTVGPQAETPTADLADSCPVGPFIIQPVDVPDLRLAIEICEDMWVPIPPGAHLALAGANVIANLSASPITIGRADSREQLVAAASARYHSAYLYCAAGQGESTTDLAWDGQSLIYEDGERLAASPRFVTGVELTYADIDLEHINGERIRQNSFHDNRIRTAEVAADGERPAGMSRWDHPVIVTPELGVDRDSDLGLMRSVSRFPFVPNDPKRLDQDCFEAFNIQVTALMHRMRAIGDPRLVIGVSGGLDSTHALLVAVQAMDRLNRPRTDILAFTMPGFATSAHTKSNAIELCERLGVSVETIDIRPAATQMLKDMGHPAGRGEAVYDVTFENVQAGLRTDYLFRIANQRGGIVLGTGDLSELALGWCTYGVGDQMSHYNVNGGVPKTLMQHLIRWVIANPDTLPEVAAVLSSILNTEITPELVPTVAGQEPQSTEASIGPYALHDFTLYHLLRYGAHPARIAFLAWHAWRDATVGDWPHGYPAADRTAYDLETIVVWLRKFYWRFFTNQFKRSALPNGPKVLAGGALSPRGDWRMPSDIKPAAWLAQLDAQLPPQLRQNEI